MRAWGHLMLVFDVMYIADYFVVSVYPRTGECQEDDKVAQFTTKAAQNHESGQNRAKTANISCC
jgi:hypothetical protein